MHRRLFLLVLALILLILSPLPSRAEGPARTHQVRPGDTLIAIAQLYGVSVTILMQANGIGNPHRIFAGQVLSIPGPGAAATSSISYRVRPGDSVLGLAARYGVSPAAIQQANGLANPHHIVIGQLLRIPVPGASPASPAAAPVVPVAPTAEHLAHALVHERAGESAIAINLYRAAAGASSPGGREALLGLGRSLLQAGDAAGAASAARSVLGAAPEDARAWVLLGRALERAGNRAAAAEAFSRALSAGAQPAAYFRLRLARVSGSAGEYRAVLEDPTAMGRWKAEAAASLGDAQAYRYASPRQQPDLLRQSGQWAELARRYPCSSGAGRGLAAVGLLEQAAILYCQGDYRTAEALLTSSRLDAGARVYLAKTRVARGDHAGALSAVQPLLGSDQGPWTAEVWLEAARAYGGVERWAEAAAAFARFSASYPGSMGWEDTLNSIGGWTPDRPSSLPAHPLSEYLPNVRRQVEEAAFGAGLDRYLGGDRLGAAAHWAAWAQAGVSPSARARMLLWQGKSEPARAQDLWRQAAEADPEGYYGLRARALAEGGSPGGGMEGPAGAAPLTLPEGWLASFARARASAESEAALAAHQALQAHSLWDEATHIVRDSISAQGGDVRSLTVLAFGLHQQGAHRLATSAMGRALASAPPSHLAALPADVQVVLFPPAYAEALWTTARAHGVDPALFSALVRVESLFDPYAVSSARAMGLTQIIPSTARAIVRELGPADFALGDLFQPELSLRMGAYYFGIQLRRFGWWGQAAAAYNGGPTNSARWYRLAAGDRDLFVETIHLAETRNYVKRLEETRYHFARLY